VLPGKVGAGGTARSFKSGRKTRKAVPGGLPWAVAARR